jgi:endonuclease/exonuclease/phosphatase family metal-dependent hydrolase
MRLISWNIRHGSPGRGRSVDLAGVAGALRGLAPDVAALQEVDRSTVRSWGVDQAAALAGSLGLRHVHGRARALLGGAVGNAVLTRAAPSGVEGHPLPTAGEPRVLVVVRVPWPGPPSAGAEPTVDLTVACTHLQHRRGAPEREAPGQLRWCLELLAGRSGPVVLCGDLNLTEEAVLPELERAGFRAATTGPTFPAGRPRRRIDWVAVRGAEVVHAAVAPVPDRSDHRPVVVDLAHPGADVAEPDPTGG